jgi:tetratricopeptide (TPR) repeat protein
MSDEPMSDKSMSHEPMSDESMRQAAEDHYYAALDLVADGQHELALAEYQKSLEADPAFSEAMHGMARALSDLGRIDEAILVALRIVAIEPDDILAHTSLSVLYQKKGMIPEAEAEGNKARVLGWKQQLKGKKSE